MAWRARLWRVELPPEISAGVGKLRLLLNRFFAHKRVVPGKIIESAPSIKDDELPPPVGNPGRAIEVLFAAIRIDATAAPHRTGVKDADLKNVGLRCFDGCARLRQKRCRRQTGPQFGKLRATFAQIGRLHATLFHHREVVPSIDDANCLVASWRVSDATLFELVGEHEPKGTVVLV